MSTSVTRLDSHLHIICRETCYTLTSANIKAIPQFMKAYKYLLFAYLQNYNISLVCLHLNSFCYGASIG